MLFLCAVYKPKYGNCWPVMGSVKDILAKNFEKLQTLLPTDDYVIYFMERNRCLTPEQLTSLRSITDGRQRKERLLDMLRRSDGSTYNRFFCCMVNLEQTKVGTLMTESSGKRYFYRLCVA